MIKFYGNPRELQCHLKYLADKYGKNAMLKEIIEKEKANDRR